MAISIREFARREGVSDTLIHLALKQGRLAKLPGGKMDEALVGSGWRAGRAKDSAKDASQSANDTRRGSYADALAEKERYTAQLRRLAVEEKEGRLVELAVVQAIFFDAFRSQRDSWLNWPTRVAPLVAAALGVTDIERVTRVLDEQVYAHLCSLGEPSGEAFSARR
jgi:hypothetical protein